MTGELRYTCDGSGAGDEGRPLVDWGGHPCREEWWPRWRWQQWKWWCQGEGRRRSRQRRNRTVSARSARQARVYALFDTPSVAVLRAACPQGPRKMSVPAVGALGRTRVGQTGGGRETQ